MHSIVLHTIMPSFYNTGFFDSFLGECAFEVYISTSFLHCHLDLVKRQALVQCIEPGVFCNIIKKECMTTFSFIYLSATVHEKNSFTWKAKCVTSFCVPWDNFSCCGNWIRRHYFCLES